MTLLGKDLEIHEQIDMLHFMLSQNEKLMQIFDTIGRFDDIRMYVAGGSICQSVWNCQLGQDPMYGIKDFDVVYFKKDAPVSDDDGITKEILDRCRDMDVQIDVNNQDKIPGWFLRNQGIEIPPYECMEDAVKRWPTVCGCIAVRIKNGDIRLIAPYGLNDMFSQILVMNRRRMDKEIYDRKVKNWTEKWPTLQNLG